MKAENQRLRTQLEAGDTVSKPCVPSIEIDELESAKAQLKKCKEDFQRVMRARSILEMRCRHYREIQKEWKVYYHHWILRHPNEDPRTRIGGPSTNAASSFQANRRSESAPAPPSCPETTSSLSDTSRPSSPPQMTPHHSFQCKENIHGGEEQLVDIDQLGVPQAALDGNDGLDVVDPFATTDEPEGELSTSFQVATRKNDNGKVSPNGSPRGLDANSDSPIFVSERYLKRKKPVRASGNDIHIHEDNSSRRDRCTVKDEQRSSSPLQSLPTTKPSAAVTDSLDLDDFGDSLYTPRKRQRLEQVRLRASEKAPALLVQATNLHSDEASEEGREQLSGFKDEGSAASLDENEKVDFLMDPAQEEAQRKQARKEAKVAQQNLYNERVHQRLSSKEPKFIPPTILDVENRAPTTTRDVKERQRKARLVGAAALQPTDTNALPRTGDVLLAEKRDCPPSRRNRGAAQVPALAEDGDDPTPSKSRRNLAAKIRETVKAPDAHRRLGTLLTDPSPAKAPIVSSLGFLRSAASVKGIRHSATKAAPITPQSLPPRSKFKTPAYIASKSDQPLRMKPNHPLTTTEPSDILPGHVPLRARPLRRLRLEDFKLNPNHSNYAHHETIRTHDERKSRSGCTDPFCQRCKDLKRFVEMSGYTASKKSGLFDSSPLEGAEDTTEEQLLKDFLGGDAYRLGQLSDQERKALLVKAKTKHFQDQFGKHRQGMSRAYEPPGFWNADFPSTQENERLREEAGIMERQKVEERWEEAMRNGMWLFADEVAKSG